MREQRRFNFDAAGVVYCSKHLKDPLTQALAHNPIDVLEYLLDLEDPTRACARCDRWDGWERTQTRNDETARRPPGVESRASCDKCFVSYLDVEQVTETPGAIITKAKARDLRSEWRELVEVGAELVEAKERYITKREKADYKSRLNLVAIKLHNVRRECLASGFDPLQSQHSGGFSGQGPVKIA